MPLSNTPFFCFIIHLIFLFFRYLKRVGPLKSNCLDISVNVYFAANSVNSLSEGHGNLYIPLFHDLINPFVPLFHATGISPFVPLFQGAWPFRDSLIFLRVISDFGALLPPTETLYPFPNEI